jgi:hypothetical protein
MKNARVLLHAACCFDLSVTHACAIRCCSVCACRLAPPFYTCLHRPVHALLCNTQDFPRLNGRPRDGPARKGGTAKQPVCHAVGQPACLDRGAGARQLLRERAGCFVRGSRLQEVTFVLFVAFNRPCDHLFRSQPHSSAELQIGVVWPSSASLGAHTAACLGHTYSSLQRPLLCWCCQVRVGQWGCRVGKARKQSCPLQRPAATPAASTGCI